MAGVGWGFPRKFTRSNWHTFHLSSIVVHGMAMNGRTRALSLHEGRFAGKEEDECKRAAQPEMKINKLMVHRRLCSRREANDYIKRGLVLVCLQYVENLTHLKRKHSLSHTHNNAHIIQHIKYAIAFILEYTLHVHDYSEKNLPDEQNKPFHTQKRTTNIYLFTQ